MHAALILSTLGLASGATLGVRERSFGCGTKEPTVEHQMISKHLAVQEAIAQASNFERKRAPIVVDTYFHIVASSNKTEDGWIPEQQMEDQLAVMNANFAPNGISFNLIDTTRTINEEWANDWDELAMKQALRKGGYDSLNVYFQKSIGGNLGYCYFPTEVVNGSTQFFLDGCSILYTTVPGGGETNYDEGKTVTHEVGHWFGLYHTFQGGCNGAGDSVADTPAQSSPTSGCPIGRDSCPTQPGIDPIHNYMDYSYDPCYEEFTAGQE